MKSIILLLLTSLALVPSQGIAQTQNLAVPRLRAGAAKVDISPAQSDLPIATDSVRDPLFVRAIFVEDGRTRAVIVTVDAGGLGDDVVYAAIAQSSAATHTHSGRSGANVTQITTARIGYGTAQLDLNVNRDLYNARQEWR